jgi:hypothetical protein
MPKKSEYIGLKVEPSLRAALEAEAQAQGRSLANLITLYLVQALEQTGRIPHKSV